MNKSYIYVFLFVVYVLFVDPRESFATYLSEAQGNLLDGGTFEVQFENGLSCTAPIVGVGMSGSATCTPVPGGGEVGFEVVGETFTANWKVMNDESFIESVTITLDPMAPNPGSVCDFDSGTAPSTPGSAAGNAIVWVPEASVGIPASPIAFVLSTIGAVQPKNTGDMYSSLQIFFETGSFPPGQAVGAPSVFAFTADTDAVTEPGNEDPCSFLEGCGEPGCDPALCGVLEIPTLSTWGLGAFALLLVASSAIILGRRRLNT